MIPYQAWQTLKQEKVKYDCKPAAYLSKRYADGYIVALDIRGVFTAKITLPTGFQLPDDELVVVAFKRKHVQLLGDKTAQDLAVLKIGLQIRVQT
jgi:hypothetical protein